MPSRLDDDDPAARHQAGVGGRRVPGLGFVADDLAIRVLPVLDRVVDQQQMRATAGDWAANAHCDVGAILPYGATASDVEALGRLAVGAQRHAGEDGAESRVRDLVAHLPTEIISKLLRVGRGDHVVVRVAPKIPGREELAGQHGLAVPRRHGDHQAGDLATLDGLELAGDQPMMRGIPVPRPLQRRIADQTRVGEVLSCRHEALRRRPRHAAPWSNARAG